MTRTILAIATTALAATTLLASAAQACISCEYVPEVVKASSKKSFTASSYERKRVHIAKKDLGVRLPKAHLAKTDLAARKVEAAKKVEVAKSEPVAKKAESAETAPDKTQAVNETETLSTASSVDTEATPAEETKVAGNVGCKRFFPAVGVTLTVPCE